MLSTRTHLVQVIAQIAIACALTWGLLELARYLVGRPAVWIVAVALLLLAAFGLWRLRK